MPGYMPDLNSWINEAWGWPQDVGGISGEVLLSRTLASNVIVGNNPPYSINDFIASYPSFGGGTASFTATGEINTTSLTISAGNVAIGQLITGPGIPNNCIVTAFASTVATISKPLTAALADATCAVYNSMQIPMPILMGYIFLASISLASARYHGMWTMVMGLFIAHYATLWAQSQQVGATATIQQIAASGLAVGLMTGESAGDVSLSQQFIDDLKGWGTYQLTIFGQQFATIAKGIGSAGMLAW